MSINPDAPAAVEVDGETIQQRVSDVTSNVDKETADVTKDIEDVKSLKLVDLPEDIRQTVIDTNALVADLHSLVSQIVEGVDRASKSGGVLGTLAQSLGLGK